MNNPMLLLNTEASQMSFSADVGRLYFQDGQLHFEGRIEESAKVFLQFLNLQGILPNCVHCGKYPFEKE